MQKEFSPTEKAAILKEHFIEQVPIRQVLNKHNITRNIFDTWVRNVFNYSELVLKKVPQDAMTYPTNYDVITTWFTSIFKDKTLDILGIKTAPIKNVSSYKPVEIMISAGMVDIVMEDMNGNAYHIEEQRNMSEEDLGRFAVYHFSASRDWNYKIHDIILISGTPYSGIREIKTPHGTYCPIFVDFTLKDGFKRLKEIKAAIDKGDASVIIELIFLPLYGKTNHKELAEAVLDYEVELCKANKMPEIYLAATLIMSNKILDYETLNKIWKDLKMLDIFAFAHEKGRNEGRGEGIKGSLFAILESSIGKIPESIVNKINTIAQESTLLDLLKVAPRCKCYRDFELALA
ncbi:hypothetical protein MHK_005521 [Candidatus Magnetomorum sp. HK-1]|nr:hypothetical protein MHK_005521 [Candidatus Magnetomorum sp. HK-1]